MKTTMWTREPLKVGGKVYGEGREWTITEVVRTGKSRVELFGKMSDRANKQRTHEHQVTMS
jgi:hypothetical protein